jgi:hypothetical protein
LSMVTLSGRAHDRYALFDDPLGHPQGQFSVSASEACAPLAIARGAVVMLASPYTPKAHHTASTLAIALRPIGGIRRCIFTSGGRAEGFVAAE